MMNRIIGAYIEITGQCNEKCPYCYNEKLMQECNELPVEIISKLSDELLEMGITAITLSGGEPFLHAGINRILKISKEKGIRITAISNGTCFHPDYMGILLTYSPSLQLTFDGYDQKTHDATRGLGNFERLTMGYYKARQLGYNGSVSIRINLHQKNVSELGSILDMISRVFEVDTDNSVVSSISLSYVHKADWHDDRFDAIILPEQYGNQIEISNSIKAWNSMHRIQIKDITSEPDIGCPFNGEKASVDCGIRIAINGDVFPCQLFSDPQFCIGNVYSTSIQEIANGESMSQFLQLIKGRHANIPKCSQCAFHGVCGSGCPGQAFGLYGTLYAITERCAERKVKLSNKLRKVFDSAVQLSQRQIE